MLALLAVSGTSARSQAQSLNVPPISTTIVVGSISATVITSFVPALSRPSNSDLKLHATSNIGEVQTKIWPILRERFDTSDPCGRIIEIRSARLVPSDPAGKLDISVHTEDASCANPGNASTRVRTSQQNTQIQLRILPSAAQLHFKFDAQIVSVRVNGAPGDEQAAFGLPSRVRTLLPDLLFAQLQPDAPENRLPALLAQAASLENPHFVDLGGGRVGLAADVALTSVALTAVRLILGGKTDTVPTPPSAVQERNLQVGFGRWPVDGTLTVPSGRGPFSAVLLMRDENILDRDGTFNSDKPLREYAWGLGARGIAVLRYDVRRWAYLTAMAKANEPLDTQEDVLADAVSALGELRGEPNIRQDRIFVLGQVDAGVLSPRVGISASHLAGLILVSSSPRMRWEMMNAVAERILADPKSTAADKQNATQLAESAMRLKSTPADKWTAGIGNLPASYWHFWQIYSPGAEAARFQGSILLLAGSNANPFFAADWARWQEALSGHHRVTLKVYPELNPLLQAGAPSAKQSGFPEARPISPSALDHIAAWIRAQ
jgi:hypothetical protein